MVRVPVPGVILIFALATALAACQPARSGEDPASGEAAPTAGRPSDAEAKAAIEGALRQRLTSESQTVTEPCDAFFEIQSVKVVGGSGDGARATVDYDVKVKATYELRASERANNCYNSPGSRGWKAGQVAKIRHTAEFERVDGAWRIVRAIR